MLLVGFQVVVVDEWDAFVGRFSAEHVAEGHVFEADVLPDIVVVRDVNSYRNA